MPTRREVKNTLVRRVVNTLASPWLGVVLLASFVPFLLIPAFLPQGLPGEKYVKVLGEETFRIISAFNLHRILHSTAFYILMSLFLLNVLLCTVRRIAYTGGPMRLFPSFFAHFFLIFLTGAFIQSSLNSAFREVVLTRGEVYNAVYPLSDTRWARFLEKRGTKVEDLDAGFSLKLVNFGEKRECRRGREAVVNWESTVEVLENNGQTYTVKIGVNRPFERGQLKFYQWAFEYFAVFSNGATAIAVKAGDKLADFLVKKILPGGLACIGVKGPAVKILRNGRDEIVEVGDTLAGFTFQGVHVTSVLGMRYDPAVPFVKAFAYIFNLLLIIAFVERIKEKTNSSG